MSRNITIIGLIQVLLVVLGFFALGIVMKLNGYPQENPDIRWNPMALWLRQYGLILLLFTVVWTVFAALSQNRPRFVIPEAGWGVLGIALSVTTIGLFLYACVDPFDRPLLMGGDRAPHVAVDTQTQE